MILVVTGMDAFPFDRLARAADELDGSRALGEEVFIQLGACRYVPVHARYERFLSFGDVCDRIRAASAVITHAGAGSTLVCLQLGRHPIVVPRRPDLGEVTDGHQVQFAERLARDGLATPVHDLSTLADAVVTARNAGVPRGPPASRAELTAWLDGYWRAVTSGGEAR